MRGNMIDMAVGIVVGAAFGKIVSSLVADVIMPPLGLLLGGKHFTGLAVTLKRATADAPAVTLNYGAFIQNILDFLIIAAAIFLLVKAINALRRKPDPTPVPPAPTAEEKLLAEIRDLLKKAERKTAPSHKGRNVSQTRRTGNDSGADKSRNTAG